MLHFGSFEIRTDVFLLILFFLVFFVQLLLCFKVKNLVVRLIPSCLFALMTAVFFVLIFVFDGWDSLGFLLLAICTASLLLACGIAWCVCWITHRSKRSKINTENSYDL